MYFLACSRQYFWLALCRGGLISNWNLGVKRKVGTKRDQKCILQILNEVLFLFVFHLPSRNQTKSFLVSVANSPPQKTRKRNCMRSRQPSLLCFKVFYRGKEAECSLYKVILNTKRGHLNEDKCMALAADRRVNYVDNYAK